MQSIKSQKNFCDFRLTGLFYWKKILRISNHIVRNLNTNKTQIQHRIRLRKYNPGNPAEDDYQETQWEIDDNLIVPDDKLNTLALEAEFGWHLSDNPTIYTEPRARDFMEVPPKNRIPILSRDLIFMTWSMVKPGKLAPLLTHLQYILQILNCMVKIKTLRPLQIHIILIVQNKHLSRICTLKLQLTYAASSIEVE